MVLAESVNNVKCFYIQLINFQDKEFFEKHKIKKIDHKGSIGIDVNVGGFEITPVGRNKCILKGIANINPHFDWVPKDLLNWILRKVKMKIYGCINWKREQSKWLIRSQQELKNSR